MSYNVPTCAHLTTSDSNYSKELLYLIFTVSKYRMKMLFYVIFIFYTKNVSNCDPQKLNKLNVILVFVLNLRYSISTSISSDTHTQTM